MDAGGAPNPMGLDQIGAQWVIMRRAEAELEWQTIIRKQLGPAERENFLLFKRKLASLG